MSLFINKNTNEYPLYEGDIRLRHPEIGESFILPEDYSEVEESSIPVLLENQIAEEQLPVNVNGVFSRTFIIRDLTEDEILEKEKIKMFIGKIDHTPVDNIIN